MSEYTDKWYRVLGLWAIGLFVALFFSITTDATGMPRPAIFTHLFEFLLFIPLVFAVIYYFQDKE